MTILAHVPMSTVCLYLNCGFFYFSPYNSLHRLCFVPNPTFVILLFYSSRLFFLIFFYHHFLEWIWEFPKFWLIFLKSVKFILPVMAAAGSLLWRQVAACHGGSWQPVMATAGMYMYIRMPGAYRRLKMEERQCKQWKTSNSVDRLSLFCKIPHFTLLAVKLTVSHNLAIYMYTHPRMAPSSLSLRWYGLHQPYTCYSTHVGRLQRMAVSTLQPRCWVQPYIGMHCSQA